MLPHITQDGCTAETHLPHRTDMTGIHASQCYDFIVDDALCSGIQQLVPAEGGTVSCFGDAVEHRAEEDIIARVLSLHDLCK